MPGKDLESALLARKWPEGAWEYYVENNFIVADSVLWHGMRINVPFHWSEAPLVNGRESLGKKVLETADHAGMKEGFAVPIVADDGPKYIASFCGRHVSVPESEYLSVSIVLHYAFNRLRELLGKSMKRPGELSSRERQVVQWVALGKTTNDVAEILDISPRTVIMHLENAGIKLNAANRPNLVAEAIRYKQISI